MIIIDFLWNMLKILCLIVGIMILISIMLDLLTAPLKKRKEEKDINELIDVMQKSVEEALIELEKENKQEKPKRKYTKKTTKNKEN